MRLFGLLLVLGLMVSTTAWAGTENWAAYTYDKEFGWVLDLPGPCGDRLSYLVVSPAPVDDEAEAYSGCIVADSDEEVGTITLLCTDGADVVIEFPELCAWVDLNEESCEPLLAQDQVELVCSGNWCTCGEGKCSVCCPEGTLPKCTCGGTDRCECQPVAEPEENEAES